MIDAGTIAVARDRIAASAGVPMGFLFGEAHPTCRGTIGPLDWSPVMRIQAELQRRAKKAQRMVDFIGHHGHAPPRHLQRRQRHRVGPAKR